MSCCSRKRSLRDIFFLPIALSLTVLGLSAILVIEMSIAYALGVI